MKNSYNRYAKLRQWKNTKKYLYWTSSDVGIGALCEYLNTFYYQNGIEYLCTKITENGGYNELTLNHNTDGTIDLYFEYLVENPNILTDDIFRTDKNVLIDVAKKFHIINQLSPLPDQLIMYVNDSGFIDFELFFRISIAPYHMRIQEMISANTPYALCIKWRNRNTYDFDSCGNQSLESLQIFFDEYYYSQGVEYIRKNINTFGPKGFLGLYRDDSLFVLHQATTNPNYYKTDAAFYTTPAELLAITEQFDQYHQQNPMPEVIVIYRDTSTNKVHMKPLYKEIRTNFWHYVRNIFNSVTGR